MAAAVTKKRKGFINEEDVSTLLHRYNATTILALLQEVAQFAGVRIDWSMLVKKTSTGITSAREYQMLWRHLAYCDTLMAKVEDSAEPLDDDSDLEVELEAVPAISAECSSEAAACVKVLISSGSQRDTCPMGRSTVEAPLTINIPTEKTSLVPSDKSQSNRSTSGLNITVPVSIPKQLTPTGPSADLDGNQLTGSGLPPKKKRRLWTEEEEKELVDAVQKFGEGNWSGILKGNFKHKLQNRTASQMSQRYAAIRKRQGNPKPITTNKSHNSTRSEEMLAAQKALSLAIDMPMTRNFSSLFSGNTPSYTPATTTVSSSASEAQPISTQMPSTSKKVASNPPNKPITIPSLSEAQPISSQVPHQSQSHQTLDPTAYKIGASVPSSKPNTTSPLSEAQPTSVPNQSQQALNLATLKKVAPNPSSKPSTTPSMSEAQPFSAQTPNKPQQALDTMMSKKVASNPSSKPGTTSPSSEAQHVSSQVPTPSQALNLATLRKGVSNPFNKPKPALKKQIAPSMPSATPATPLAPSATTAPSPPPATPPPVAPSPLPATPPPVAPATPPVTSPPLTVALVPSTPSMPPACSGSLIQAAALAAGGRIATPSTAASLLKAANSKSAVRIPPLGSPLTKAQGIAGNMSPVLKQATKARRTQLVANPSASKARRSAGKPASFSTSSALASKSVQLHIGDVQETGGSVTDDVSTAMDTDEVELDSMDQDPQKSSGF